MFKSAFNFKKFKLKDDPEEKFFTHKAKQFIDSVGVIIKLLTKIGGIAENIEEKDKVGNAYTKLLVDFNDALRSSRNVKRQLDRFYLYAQQFKPIQENLVYRLEVERRDLHNTILMADAIYTKLIKGHEDREGAGNNPHKLNRHLRTYD